MATTNKRNGDWLTLLQSAITSGTVDEVPMGFKTRQQLADEIGISYASLGRKLPALEAQGKITKQSFRIVDRSGRAIKTPHWRIS